MSLEAGFVVSCDQEDYNDCIFDFIDCKLTPEFEHQCKNEGMGNTTGRIIFVAIDIDNMTVEVQVLEDWEEAPIWKHTFKLVVSAE